MTWTTGGATAAGGRDEGRTEGARRGGARGPVRARSALLAAAFFAAASFVAASFAAESPAAAGGESAREEAVDGVAAPAALVHAEGVAPHAGLDAIYRRFSAAYDALDAGAVAGLYGVDALYLAPGSEVMRGRPAIAVSFAGFFEAVRAEGGRLAIRFEILDRVVAPGLASDVGHFVLSRSGGGRTSTMRGKFSVVAREEADGAWRFHVDSYSGVEEEARGAGGEGSAAAEPVALTSEEREARRAALVAAEAAFADAFARRDRAAFFAAVAPDAVFLAPDRALVGKAEVEEVWGGFFDAAEAPFSWRPVRGELDPAGETGLTNGPVYDAAGQWIGSFQSLWRRQPDGSWRVVWDGAPPCKPPS